MEKWQKNMAELAKGALIVARWERWAQLRVWEDARKIYIPIGSHVSPTCGFGEFNRDGKVEIKLNDGQIIEDEAREYPSEDLIARCFLAVQFDPTPTPPEPDAGANKKRYSYGGVPVHPVGYNQPSLLRKK